MMAYLLITAFNKNQNLASNPANIALPEFNWTVSVVVVPGAEPATREPGV